MDANFETALRILHEEAVKARADYREILGNDNVHTCAPTYESGRVHGLFEAVEILEKVKKDLQI